MMNHAPRRRGRLSGITPDRLRKGYIIAAAVIQGSKIAQIAASLGVSRPWASREAKSPGVRNIELFETHRKKIQQVVYAALDALSEVMKARKVYVCKGKVIQGGPDHRMRLKAVKVSMALLNAFGRVRIATGSRALS